MEQERNLAELCKTISNKLLDSIYTIDILEDMVDEDAKCILLLKNLRNNTHLAFDEIEQCRKMVYILDD